MALTSMLSATKVYFRISSRFAVLFCFVFSWKEGRLSGREKWWRRREKVIKSKIFFFFFFRVKKRRIVKSEGETRISSLSLLVEIRRGYRFDLKERRQNCCWCWRIPLILMTWAKGDDVSSLSLSRSLRHEKKNKKNVWVFSFGKKWEEKKTQN